MASIPVFSGTVGPGYKPDSAPIENIALDAYTQGAKLGQAIPSTTAAISQGIQGAVQTYDANQAADDQHQIRQQQLSDMQDQSALDAQLEPLKIQAQTATINATAAKSQAALLSLQVKQKADTAAANSKAAVLGAFSQIQSGDVAGGVEALNTNYSDLLASTRPTGPGGHSTLDQEITGLMMSLPTYAAKSDPATQQAAAQLLDRYGKAVDSNSAAGKGKPSGIAPAAAGSGAPAQTESDLILQNAGLAPARGQAPQPAAPQQQAPVGAQPPQPAAPQQSPTQYNGAPAADNLTPAQETSAVDRLLQTDITQEQKTSLIAARLKADPSFADAKPEALLATARQIALSSTTNFGATARGNLEKNKKAAILGDSLAGQAGDLLTNLQILSEASGVPIPMGEGDQVASAINKLESSAFGQANPAKIQAIKNRLDSIAKVNGLITVTDLGLGTKAIDTPQELATYANLTFGPGVTFGQAQEAVQLMQAKVNQSKATSRIIDAYANSGKSSGSAYAAANSYIDANPKTVSQRNPETGLLEQVANPNTIPVDHFILDALIPSRQARNASGRSIVAQPSSAPTLAHKIADEVSSGSFSSASSQDIPENLPAANEALVRRVIEAESSGNPNAVGPETKYGTAKGLMQLIDSTGKQVLQQVLPGDPYAPHEPFQNVLAGTTYINTLLKKYGGDVRSTLAANNWGMGNFDAAVAKVKKITGHDPEWSDLLGFMPAETRNYVTKIMGSAVPEGDAEATAANASGSSSSSSSTVNPAGATAGAPPPDGGASEPGFLENAATTVKDAALGFATGDLQGVSYGTGDELVGGLNSLITGQDRRTATANVRNTMEGIRARSPIATATGDIFGSIASGKAIAGAAGGIARGLGLIGEAAPAVTEAASGLSNIARTAVAGGAAGAARGYGEGQDGNRGSTALTYGALGAAGGAAVGTVAELGKAALNSPVLKNAASKVWSAVNGGPKPTFTKPELNQLELVGANLNSKESIDKAKAILIANGKDAEFIDHLTDPKVRDYVETLSKDQGVSQRLVTKADETLAASSNKVTEVLQPQNTAATSKAAAQAVQNTVDKAQQDLRDIGNKVYGGIKEELPLAPTSTPKELEKASSIIDPNGRAVYGRKAVTGVPDRVPTFVSREVSEAVRDPSIAPAIEQAARDIPKLAYEPPTSFARVQRAYQILSEDKAAGGAPGHAAGEALDTLKKAIDVEAPSFAEANAKYAEGAAARDAVNSKYARAIAAHVDGNEVKDIGKLGQEIFNADPETIATQMARLAPADQEAFREAAKVHLNNIVTNRGEQAAAKGTGFPDVTKNKLAEKIQAIFEPDQANNIINTFKKGTSDINIAKTVKSIAPRVAADTATKLDNIDTRLSSSITQALVGGGLAAATSGQPGLGLASGVGIAGWGALKTFTNSLAKGAIKNTQQLARELETLAADSPEKLGPLLDRATKAFEHDASNPALKAINSAAHIAAENNKDIANILGITAGTQTAERGDIGKGDVSKEREKLANAQIRAAADVVMKRKEFAQKKQKQRTATPSF